MKALRWVRAALSAVMRAGAAAGAAVATGVEEDAVAMASYFCVPNRPAGRISSTMVMMMKITVVEASG